MYLGWILWQLLSFYINYFLKLREQCSWEYNNMLRWIMIWDYHLTEDCTHIQLSHILGVCLIPTYSLQQTVSPRHVLQINEGMVEEIIKGQSHLRLSLEKIVKQVSAWLWHFWLFRYLIKTNKYESFKTCACIYVLNRTCNALLSLACNDSKWCLPSLVSPSSCKVLSFQCFLLKH